MNHIYDSHVHIFSRQVDQTALLAAKEAAGVDGGVLISPAPEAFADGFPGPTSTKERLDCLLQWTSGTLTLFPFYWIDPTEKDAIRQVRMAAARGVMGFKVICNHFYPGDAVAMDTYRAIARTGKPLLFHSGILWDSTPSSKYCRPVEFEAMIDVPGIRFALAHISWPWIDECLATYGKFLATRKRRPSVSCEMFIDLTPGTPPIYRREALTKIHTIGYEIADNLLFGTDNRAVYLAAAAAKWIKTDNAIYDALDVGPKTREKIYGRNLMRFLKP